jgi:hypothetical protein
MSTLWPRNRPLNQPPHAGRIGMQPEHAKPCPVQAGAEATLRAVQWDREQKTRRNGAKATVR